MRSFRAPVLPIQGAALSQQKKTRTSGRRTIAHRRSTAASEVMEADFIVEEEDLWKCRKHPSRPRSGVCPSCLRDRLLLLCPDCANLLPCSCFPSPSSSSSFSSRSSFDPARSSVSGAIGAIGRVSNLIESEPAFRRSRSAALPFLRRRTEQEAAERAEKGRKWGSSLWSFLRAAKEKKAEVSEEETRSEIEKFSRSRSVGFPIYLRSGSAEGRLKAKKWHFPSPMRAFRQKKTAKVVRERSPLCRG